MEYSGINHGITKHIGVSKMKVKLTEDSLWVNSYKCKSVTITQKETNLFEAILFDIEGITKRVPKMTKWDKQDKNTLGELLFITTKLRKKKKSKTLIFEGIKPTGTTYLHAKNSKGEYINYYPIVEV